jgi:starch synthase
MRIDLLTKEYPPHIYGGAGVHVAELVRALRETDEVQVRCFGAERDEPDVSNYEVPREFAGSDAVLQTLATDLAMANDVAGATVVHSHTWYANEAGRLAQLLWGVPHVITAHSLEPLRPWKAEQLGGGYRLSSDIEKRAYLSADAVIAVSDGMRKDILAAYPDINPDKVFVVHNGIDAETWRPRSDASLLARYGINPDSRSVIFVGRITRQKGLPYLLAAVKNLDPDVQIILCAGAPDTTEIMDEVRSAVEALGWNATAWCGLKNISHSQSSAVCCPLQPFLCARVSMNRSEL